MHHLNTQMPGKHPHEDFRDLSVGKAAKGMVRTVKGSINPSTMETYKRNAALLVCWEVHKLKLFLNFMLCMSRENSSGKNLKRP